MKRVTKENVENKVYKELRVIKEIKENKDYKAKRVTKAIKVIRVKTA